MHKKVYISSTYKDLVPYRDAIRDMFQHKGLQEEYLVIGMEGYVSENGKKPIEVCLEDVREVDIYILILAQRYGSIVEGEGISYTEMEYREARRMQAANPNYTIFVFWSEADNEEDDFENAQGPENLALEQFYESAKSENASFIHPFTTPDNLCKQILLTFNYNFKKPSSLNDYREALLLVDRVHQSYKFSRQIRQRVNSFYFSSLYQNFPNDFIERIYSLEMGGSYNKCNLELGQINQITPAKFKVAFYDHLSSQWGKERATRTFNYSEKLFLSIELNSVQIQSDVKLEHLHAVLLDLLPNFLMQDANTSSNNVFVLFYSYVPTDEAGIKKFDAFTKKLIKDLNIPGCLIPISELNDITKTDVRNWLENFIRSHKFDQHDLDELLDVGDNPFANFKMSKVNKSIKDWLKENMLTK